MPLKNTNTFPPGGFPYTQKETGYKFAGMVPFKQQGRTIMDHRRANGLPRATYDEAAKDLDDYTCLRLGNDPRHCQTAQKKTMWSSTQHLRNLAGLAGEAISHAVKGGAVLHDWLGEGGEPVTQSLAEARANTCINLCSDPEKGFNKKGHFFARLTTVVANAILDQRREKLNLGLAVEGEDKLHSCSVCACHLPLKIWVPLHVLNGRMKEGELEQFPSYCWLREENRHLQTQTAETPSISQPVAAGSALPDKT